MTYKELKEKHQKEIHEFPFGFAFGNEQFEKMMEEWGLTTSDDDLQKIVSLGAGCYLRRQDVKAFAEMSQRHKRELKELRKSKKDLINALIYQLHNYEYGYTRSNDEVERALCALGLSWEDVRKDPFTQDCLNKAIKQVIRESISFN